MSNFVVTHTVTLQHNDGTSVANLPCQIVPIKLDTLTATGGRALTDAFLDPGTDIRDGDVLVVTAQVGATTLGSYTRYNVESVQSISVIPYIKLLVEGMRQ